MHVHCDKLCSEIGFDGICSSFLLQLLPKSVTAASDSTFLFFVVVIEDEFAPTVAAKKSSILTGQLNSAITRTGPFVKSRKN